MKKFIIVVLFFFLFKTSVSADEGWVINSFNSDILIQKNGIVQVKEIIDVDFSGLSKHGIYRDIPYKYTNPDGSKYLTEIKNINTGADKKNVSKSGDFVRIKIGDADKTISGKHTYTIFYEAVGVLKGFEDHDELYWNVTGNAWPVLIQKTSSTVKISDTTISRVECFEGYTESTTPCSVSTAADFQASAFTSTRSYSELEGMTIVVGYPKGVIAMPVVKSFTERVFSPVSLATLLLTVLVGVFLILRHWYKNGRDMIYHMTHLFDPGLTGADKNARQRIKPLFHKDQIVVEYVPPEKLRPAELGVIVDERADTLDVTSTIIDLASRGFLTITEEKKKWLFGGTDYILKKKNKDTSSLLKYEKLLYEGLFDTGDSVKVSDLKKTFYTELKDVKQELYKHVVEKGYFARNPESARGVYLGIAIVAIIFFAFIIGPVIAFENEYLFMIMVGVAINTIILLFVSRFMSKRTAKGAEIYRRTKGYHMFISHVEKYKQQFFEKRNMFNEVLPYAMVFGLTAKFAKALEKMGYKPTNPTWYYGAAGAYFSPIRFESNVSAFSGSLSSAIASTPGGSGFSGGGGGGGGGGFGGGGGGSW